MIIFFHMKLATGNKLFHLDTMSHTYIPTCLVGCFRITLSHVLVMFPEFYDFNVHLQLLKF